MAANDGQGPIAGGATGSTRDACQALTNAKDMKGNVALIERSGCEFDVKIANAEAAGAVAVVVYNNADGPIVMNGNSDAVHIPAVMIGNADGQKLVDRLAVDAGKSLAATDRVTVKLASGIFATLSGNGNIVADFSSRGPSLSDANFSKPDVSAPGVDILGGQTPDVANGLRGETYQYMSGTSQSAPETTGVAVLLKEAHPDWTPGMLKSALMTTAYQGVIREDGTPADPFDVGAGHIDPNRAIAPGLVYESDYRDHAAYLCGLHQPPFTVSECAALAAAGYSSAATDLNLPSIGLSQLITGDSVRRRVTNIGPPATFTADVTPPPNVDVFVEPPSLTLTTGQSADFSVRFVDRGTDLDAWNFGRLTWSDGGSQSVTSPISVQAVTLRAPPELYLTGTTGSTKMPAAFGYTGAYAAGVHGLRKPFLDANGQVPRYFVDNDPTNTFTNRSNNGVTRTTLTVPPNQLYLRVALFNEFTDGTDDLDLYLFYCPNEPGRLRPDRAERRIDFGRRDRRDAAPSGAIPSARARLRDGRRGRRPGSQLLVVHLVVRHQRRRRQSRSHGARRRVRWRPSRSRRELGVARPCHALSRRDLALHAGLAVRAHDRQRSHALAAPLAALAVAEAADEVVVDEPRRLHVRVDDRRADELETARFQILAERIRFLARRRHVAVLAPLVHDRRAVHELPHVRVEAAELFLDSKERTRVGDGSFDLLSIAHDAGVAHELLDGAAREASHLRCVEFRERASIAVALAKDRPPAQARLRTLEHEEFEMRAVVAHRHAPFGVVVALVRRVHALAPGATNEFRFAIHLPLAPCRRSPLAKVPKTTQNRQLRKGRE